MPDVVHTSFLYVDTEIKISINYLLTEPATGLEDSEDIIIMPAKDAVLKFGAFVGDRIYATSFLTHIK